MLGTTSSYFEPFLFKVGSFVVEELKNGGKRDLLRFLGWIPKLFFVFIIVLHLFLGEKGEFLR